MGSSRRSVAAIVVTILALGCIPDLGHGHAPAAPAANKASATVERLADLMCSGEFREADAPAAALLAGSGAVFSSARQTQALLAKSLEERLLALLQEARVAAGLSRLEPSEDLVRVARAHSRDMARLGELGHEVPPGSTPADRLVEAGVYFRNSGENVAMSTAFDPERIHASLMESPGHRANILGEGFDQVGVGVVPSDGGSFYATQVFIRRLTPLGPKEVRARIFDRLNELRAGRKQRPLAPDAKADKAAETFLARDGRSRFRLDSSEPGDGAELFFAENPDLEEIVETLASQAANPPFPKAAGLAVRFGRTDRNPEGAYSLCAVLIHGRSTHRR